MATKQESDQPKSKAGPPPGGWQAAFISIADALTALSNGEPELRWQTHLNFMAAQFRNQAQGNAP